MPDLDFGFLDFVIGFEHLDDVLEGAKYSFGCFLNEFDDVHDFLLLPHFGGAFGYKKSR